MWRRVTRNEKNKSCLVLRRRSFWFCVQGGHFSQTTGVIVTSENFDRTQNFGINGLFGSRVIMTEYKELFAWELLQAMRKKQD